VIDPNNRPGGGNLIVTAKTANKVQFFDAATLKLTGEIDMPGSTHELVLSPSGGKAFGSVYGGGVFSKNVNPDRRIAVIELATKSLERLIALDADVAPHGVMMDAAGTLWATGELGNAVFAIDPHSGAFDGIDIGGRPHWLAISHSTGKVFASCKASDFVMVIDGARRAVIGRIKIPDLAEGVAVSPDGSDLYVCAHQQALVHVIDTQSHAIRGTVPIEGAEGKINQLRRVRVSPDGRYVLVSSSQDRHAAIYERDGLSQIASIKTARSPMGFGFAADGEHAYLCCHDDAVVFVIALASGEVVGEFSTDKGCEFVIAYA
jgi:DNA-binding beta-propeller fold protein YncE